MPELDGQELVPMHDPPDAPTPPKKRRRHAWKTVATVESRDAAHTFMETYNDFLYKWYQNNGGKSKAVVHRCVFHCPNVLRTLPREGGVWIVQEAEAHGTTPSGEKKIGVSRSVKAKARSALIGAGPVGSDRNLRTEFAGDEKLLEKLPTTMQLKSMKSELKKGMEGGWIIKSPAVIMEWASDKPRPNKLGFFGIDIPDGGIQFTPEMLSILDKMIVIDVTTDKVIIQGKHVQSIGIVFSSRVVLCNAFYAWQEQSDDGLLGVTDGAYKLHLGGWTLICFGTYCTRYVNHKYSKHFVPWSFMFVRTEHECAYKALFTATKDYCRLIFGIELNLKFGGLDHCWPIANAFRSIWGDISLMTCWPHVQRKTGEKKGLLKCSAYYDTHISVHIQWIHEARSEAQFGAFVELCVREWRADGESAYADWFEEVHARHPWRSWFAAKAGPISGILPNQNALESFNATIKKSCISGLRANTATVLETSLPGILTVCGSLQPKPDERFFGHYGEGPIPSEMFVKAYNITADKRNFMRMKTTVGSSVRVVYCNASKYAFSVENRDGLTVTEARIKKYQRSLKGSLVKNKPATSICVLYLSLHEVQVLTDEHEEFALHPIWTRDEICQSTAAFFLRL